MTEGDQPPTMSPLNLALRFGLELAALGGLALAGRQLASGPTGLLAAVALPLAAAAVWGVFNVAGDPSRSGSAPVEVSGLVRLLVEAVVLGGGVFGFVVAGYHGVAGAIAALTVGHYVVARRRVAWLLHR